MLLCLHVCPIILLCQDFSAGVFILLTLLSSFCSDWHFLVDASQLLLPNFCFLVDASQLMLPSIYV